MLQALLYQANPLPLYGYPHGSQLPPRPRPATCSDAFEDFLWLPHSVILFLYRRQGPLV